MKRMLAKILRKRVTVRVYARAVATIHAASEHAAHNETGGILLGWWEDGAIVIDSALEVVDKTATGTSWTRREAAAQSALDSALRRSENENLGYVGDWHCHPAPVGASPTDLRSLTRSSIHYVNPLALIVRQSDQRMNVYAAERGKVVNVKVTE